MTPTTRAARLLPLLASATLLVAGLVLLLGTHPAEPFAAGLLRVDALSAYFLVVVGAVALTVTAAGPPPAGEPDAQLRYAGWLVLFLGAMTLTLLADNLGLMWVGIEGTTIATAFLVGHRGDRRAVEAAWKYVVLGSVGVAIALFGLVLLYAAGSGEQRTLSWSALMADPAMLDPDLARLALALAVLGLATKAGLAPMHAWLPDAHSQAPAPVSGLMSGVLLSVAFYGILRLQAVSDLVVGPGLMRALLVGGGLLSLGVATALMLGQRDLKRLLAYSSTEHLGLIALGAGIGGPLALGAALLHVVAHGLAKAVLFVTAGRILDETGTVRLGDLHGLLAERPRLAWPLLGGMATLLGLPPGALFLTELGILAAAWQQGLGWVSLLAASLLAVAFAALARHTLSITLGAGPGDDATSDAGRAGSFARPAPLGLALAATVLVGLTPGMQTVLDRAAAALGVS
ncbi:proton-conducting transporter membrane subunit [Nocardioides sp.]|uniref:proton-conducting transporter transmembrane domain-containing protein n=1 Tax=Nocardioides sp. TaxID=35761 RepID=UPI003528816C